MKNLSEFVGPVKTAPMRVEVIDAKGGIRSVFEAPPGFQLERYVDSLYPNLELMIYGTSGEVNVSVLEGQQITEIYRGTYK